MYSQVDEVYSITMSENPNFNIPLRVMKSKQYMQSIIALSYDYARSLLFYSDIQRGTIDAIHFNNTGHRIIVESMYINFIIFCFLKMIFKVFI